MAPPSATTARDRLIPEGQSPGWSLHFHSDQGAKDDGRIGAKARERSRKHDVQDGQDEQGGYDGSLLRRDGGGASTTLEGADLSCKG